MVTQEKLFFLTERRAFSSHSSEQSLPSCQLLSARRAGTQQSSVSLDGVDGKAKSIGAGALGREAKVPQGNSLVLRGWSSTPRRRSLPPRAVVAFGTSGYYEAMNFPFASTAFVLASSAPPRARPNPSTRTSTAVKRLLCISSW